MKAELFFTAEMVNLLHAIQRKDETTAKLLIEQGVNLNVHGDEGITPLLWLIMQKDAAAVELALQLGADANFPAMVKINREGPKPAQPLAILAGDGDNKLFSILLKYGADPDSRDSSTNRPAIFGCIGHDNWQQLSLLLEYGADVNAKDGSNSNSALYAADLGKYDFVYKLINEGASATQPSTTGASVAWRVHLALEKNAKNPAFRVSEETHKTKALLIEKGVTFPPPNPQEVKAQQGIK
ncbi:ankyrin repeat domain-containing protein [Rheinheimera hassiensis]|uniref:ankyrin repeat domain-containing protein n=1 Tax=Rheinheimera hassiensis TaxID=1193627 RepID=UPI001F0650EA|nr:ankyrin repeat domain-containing protein [Rheinheimera hassiensis]